VAAGALFNTVVHGGENTSVSVGPNGACVSAYTPTLKSLEVKNGGFESERNSTLDVVRTLLFIEVGECRAIVMTHVCLAVVK